MIRSSRVRAIGAAAAQAPPVCRPAIRCICSRVDGGRSCRSQSGCGAGAGRGARAVRVTVEPEAPVFTSVRDRKLVKAASRIPEKWMSNLVVSWRADRPADGVCEAIGPAPRESSWAVVNSRALVPPAWLYSLTIGERILVLIVVPFDHAFPMSSRLADFHCGRLSVGESRR
jgi:hypothetical protein